MTAAAALRSPASLAALVLAGAAALAAGAASAWLAVERFGGEAPLALVALAAAPGVAAAVVARPVLGPALVFAALALGNHSVPGVPLSLQAAEAAAVAAAALVVLSRVAVGRLLPPWSPPLWWVLALTTWVLVLTPFAVDLGRAGKQLSSLLVGLLIACVVLAAVETMRDVRLLVATFVTAAATLVAVALAARPEFTTSLGGAIVEGRPSATFGEPNHFGSVTAIALPVAAALALAARTRAARAAATVAALLIAVGLFVSFSRGAWIASAAALALLFVALPRARRMALAVGAPLLVVVSVLTLLGSPPPGVEAATARLTSFTELSPLDFRPQLQREAVRQIKTAPLTGHGPGGFRPASAVRESAIRRRADHPYNLLLTWGAETGLVGVALLLAFAASLGLAARRATRAARARGDDRDRALAVGVAAGLLAVLVHGFFDYTPRNPVIWLAVWGLIGLLLACRREQLRLLAPE